MRKILLAVAMVSISSLAFAASPGGVQATVGGVNIQGNTNMNVSAEDTSAVAQDDAVAKNQIGGIKGGTNISGNTSINVNAKGTSAVARGHAKAANSIGVIGGE
jgi:hypothetical protein